MKRHIYIKRRTKKCIVCIMLVAALFLPAVNGVDLRSVMAEELPDEEAEDGTDTIDPEARDDWRITEETITSEEVYTDAGCEGESDPVRVEGETATEVKENQDLERTETTTTVENIETRYYVTDENGNPIIAKDAEGNDVMLEVSSSFAEEQQGQEKVHVIDTTEKKEEGQGEVPAAVFPEYEEVEEEDIFYGKMENGIFIPAEPAEDGAYPEGTMSYTLTDGVYTETTEMNKVIITTGEEQESEIYVNDDVAEVIDALVNLNQGDGPDSQARKGQEKKTLDEIRKDAEEKGLGVEVDYYLAGTIKKEDGTAQEVSERIKIDPEKVHGAVVDEKTGELKIEATPVPQDEAGENGTGYYIEVDSVDKDGKPTTDRIYLSSQDVVTETVYKVVDESNNKVICEIDSAAQANIEKANFTLVNDMYVVQDKNGEDVYFTADQWRVVTGKHVVYEEVTKYYYTVEKKFDVSAPGEIILKDGEKEGKLLVKFWENDAIKRASEVRYEVKDGKIKVVVPYKYISGYGEDGTPIWTETEHIEEKTFEEWFGSSTEATLSVKYAYQISDKTTVSFEARDEKVLIAPDGKVEVIENGGKPINEGDKAAQMGKKPDGYNWHDGRPCLAHVDVKTDALTGQIETGRDENGKPVYEEINGAVSKVQVYLDGKEVPMYTGTVIDDNRQDREFLTASRGQKDTSGKKSDEMEGCTSNPLHYFEKDEAGNYKNVLITIKALITYTLPDGKEREFQYTVNVYPEPSKIYNDKFEYVAEGEESTINRCKWWSNDGGFDYTIKADVIKELIKQDMQQINTNEVKLTVSQDKVTLEPKPTDEPTPAPSESPAPSENPGTTPEATPAPSGDPGTTPEVTPAPSGDPGTTPEATPVPGTTPTPEAASTPEITPEPENTPEPESEPERTPEPGTVPGGDEPGGPVATVLGARRLQINARDAAVLGAKRGLESAVLGKRRSPATGDNAEMFLWILVLSIAIGGAFSSGIMLGRGKKKSN